jgi:hypothetical protein
MSLGQWLFDKISNYFTKDTSEEKRSYLVDFDRIANEVIPGDVILVEGTNRISQIIKYICQSPWTHSTLYIGRLHNIEDPELRHLIRRHYHGSPSHQLVIESLLGHGTFIRSINYYKDYHIRICRPTGLSHSDAQRVIGHAIKSIGHKYDVRHFIDLGRFILSGHILPRRWKSSLFQQTDPSEATKDICSAMIASAFTSINFPILPLIREDKDKKIEMIHRNPKLFTPADFDYSPYFAVIKFPFYPLAGQGPYRHLPWQTGLLSEDEGIITKLPSTDEETNK